MPNLSPRSQEVVDSLLKKEVLTEGSVSVGPFDDATIRVLGILIDNFIYLQAERGEQQAEKILDLFLAAEQFEEEESQTKKNASDTYTEPDGDEAPKKKEAAKPYEWRLTGLQCDSYRGIGPPGEIIEFPFDGRSTLIYGPNGSGKSSLVGAVVWALTGKAITDASDKNVEMVSLHETSSKGAKKGKKINDWHVAATLPKQNPASAVSECRVELELSCPKDGKKLHVRRALPGSFEVREDESQPWKNCPDLKEHGISPLDLQLSLTAPSLFGRLTIESAPDSVQLLTLMLGLDDVENIGRLAGAIAPNRTRLSTKSKNERGETWDGLRVTLNGLPAQLKETSEPRKILSDLAAKEKPSLEDIVAAGKAIRSHIESANRSIAKALGLPEKEKCADEEQDESVAPVSDDLATSLRSAIVRLKEGLEQCFSQLNSLDPVHHWDGETGSDIDGWLESMNGSLDEFLVSTRTSMKSRLDWLRRRAREGEKIDLLLHASKFYDDKTGDCPVCEETIKKEPIKSELRTFKNLDPVLLQKLDDYFRELRTELDRIVSRNLQALTKSSPSDRATADWDVLKERFGPNLASVVDQYDECVSGLVEELKVLNPGAFDLLPADAEKEFAESAAVFLKACSEARMAVAMLEWAAKHLTEANERLSDHLTNTETESLLAALSKGIDAAEEAGNLGRAKEALAAADKNRKDIEILDERIAALDRLERALTPIKDLEKYASAVVEGEFKKIKGDTLSNWDKLYPERTSGLSPANLFLEGRKDRKVQSYLGHSSFEVPGQYFANAGLQRAIALSFFFALLNDHPRGLGFIVMDDSIVSLDDDHRDRWSANILRPCMDQFQFIFATHQEVYLKYGGRIDFSDELIVELNARSDVSRITWKPGHRLESAETLIDKSYDLVPNVLRKYVEDLLLTFETYCDSPFYDQRKLEKSIKRYGNYGPPLNSQSQGKIFSILSDPKLLPVLHAGSHGATDHEVTKPMVVDQFNLLRKCEKQVGNELKRLENLRLHGLRMRPVRFAVVEFPKLPSPANWNQPITIKHLGRAAAKEDSVVIDSVELSMNIKIDCFAAVLVVGDTLDPVAKRGQWVLLGPDDESITDGCLAAVLTGDNKRLLRGVWPDGEQWLLDSINPVTRIAVEPTPRDTAALRKIKGVVFEPRQTVSAETLAGGGEWLESDGLTSHDISRLHAITVEGNSLEPIASKGQLVLIGQGTTVSSSKVSRGSLAVLQTTDPKVGNVIKRVFQSDDHWTLVSPNPVDPHDPLRVSCNDIELIYPFRGVLFERSDF